MPVTVEYSITPLGKTLAAAVDPLRDWAEQNLKEVLAAQRRYDAQTQREGGVRQIVDRAELASVETRATLRAPQDASRWTRRCEAR